MYVSFIISESYCNVLFLKHEKLEDSVSKIKDPCYINFEEFLQVSFTADVPQFLDDFLNHMCLFRYRRNIIDDSDGQFFFFFTFI